MAGGWASLAGEVPGPWQESGLPPAHPPTRCFRRPSEGFNQGVMQWDLHFERQLSGSEMRVGFGDRSVGGPHVLD